MAWEIAKGIMIAGAILYFAPALITLIIAGLVWLFSPLDK